MNIEFIFAFTFCPLINTYLQINMYSLCIYTEEEPVITLVLITKSEWEAQNTS